MRFHSSGPLSLPFVYFSITGRTILLSFFQIHPLDTNREIVIRCYVATGYTYSGRNECWKQTFMPMYHVLTIWKQQYIFSFQTHWWHSLSSSQLMTLLLLLRSSMVCTWSGQCDVFSGESFWETPPNTELDRGICGIIKNICIGFYKISRTWALSSKCCPAQKNLWLGKALLSHQKTLFVSEIFISHDALRPQESWQILVFFTPRARDGSDLVSQTLSHRKQVCTVMCSCIPLWTIGTCWDTTVTITALKTTGILIFKSLPVIFPTFPIAFLYFWKVVICST